MKALGRTLWEAAGLLGIVLLLTLSLYSGMHFFGKVIQGSPASIDATLGSAAMRWTGQQTWQSALLLTTVLYGIWLFCLQHVDAHDDYAQNLRDRRSELITKVRGATTASGIQA
jgi:hypothetical protein